MNLEVLQLLSKDGSAFIILGIALMGIGIPFSFLIIWVVKKLTQRVVAPQDLSKFITEDRLKESEESFQDNLDLLRKDLETNYLKKAEHSLVCSGNLKDYVNKDSLENLSKRMDNIEMMLQKILDVLIKK